MPGTASFWRDPFLPHVESRRACHSRACYKPHSHPTFSIGAVDAGGSVFTGSHGRQSALSAGSLVAYSRRRIFPGVCAVLPRVKGLFTDDGARLARGWPSQTSSSAPDQGHTVGLPKALSLDPAAAVHKALRDEFAFQSPRRPVASVHLRQPFSCVLE